VCVTLLLFLPQVSGMRYFHSNGTFLSAFLLRNSSQLPIDPAASYNVVTNNFMAAGGDGYTALQAGQQIYPLGPPQDQVLAAMFTSAPNGVLVAPQVGFGLQLIAPVEQVEAARTTMILWL
jgi:2',3'-cyclic-nucleotide 2'-phosphodiesterase (5'-nucleotidase family)